MADDGNAQAGNKRAGVFARLFLMLTLIALLTSTVMFVKWLNRPGNFAFKKVELVNYLDNQESKELQQIAAKALNGGFFSLNVDEFREELLAELPWVKSVSVRKIWPDKLLVEIAEYKPVVRWQSVDSLLLAEGSSSLQKQAEGSSSLQKKTKGSSSTDDYQLLSRNGIVFEPKLSSAQKVKFNKMALLYGPKMNAEKVLKKCVEINESLKQIGLAIKQCGMNKRRTWSLILTASDFTTADFKKRDGMDMSIKLGKENIMQQLERFIQIFSGKLKPFIASVEYADLRYSNGFSLKWIADNTSENRLQNSMQKKLTNKPLSK